MKIYTCLLGLVFLCQNAAAADLSVGVSDAAGKPVRDAVVTFTPQASVQISASDRSGPFVMAQKNIHFAPYVLAVPMGSTVSFPNQDKVNHHVYSFSPTQPFQLPLYGHGQTRQVKFDKAGTIALGCNIHDSMSAYIRVVATPFYAVTDEKGLVNLTDLPEGPGTLSVWQPQMDAPDHEEEHGLSLGKTNPIQTFSVKIHSVAPMTGMY